jgi:hypothetical protein
MSQILSSIVQSADGIAAITGTLQQVVTLALPPGQWIVDGEAWINTGDVGLDQGDRRFCVAGQQHVRDQRSK